MFANAHFRAKESVEYLASDFLGETNREDRQALKDREALTVMRANTSLAGIVKGAPPTEDVPDWARG
jgi:hypothetical protein